MRVPSKIHFARLVQDNSAAGFSGTEPALPARRQKRAAGIIITILVIAIGLGAGWLGGGVLGDRMRNAPPAEVTSESQPSTDGSTPFVPTPQEAQTPSKHDSGSVPSSQPPSAASDEALIPEQPPQPEPERKGAPPPTQKVKEDGTAESPTTEDSAKVGKQALKKILEEAKKPKRGQANKNGNEDPEY